jgi:hypothetical protein
MERQPVPMTLQSVSILVPGFLLACLLLTYASGYATGVQNERQREDQARVAALAAAFERGVHHVHFTHTVEAGEGWESIAEDHVPSGVWVSDFESELHALNPQIKHTGDYLWPGDVLTLPDGAVIYPTPPKTVEHATKKAELEDPLSLDPNWSRP